MSAIKQRSMPFLIPVAILAACAQEELPTSVLAVAEPAMVVTSPATDLFISEYIEGSSNNKAIEIYNGTGAPIDLGAGGYSIRMFFNGSTSAGLTINLVSTVAAGDVFVLAQSSADAAILAQADQTNGAGWFNGDDVVVLYHGTTVLDAIGQIGNDPGSEWGTGLTSTMDNTLRRKAAVCSGDTDPTNAFDPSSDWDGYATNTFDGLGAHSASCLSPTDCLAPFTAAWEIQGNGASTPLDQQIVVTQGVVVGDYEGGLPALQGFFLQDQTGDSDPATSDGVFVYNGSSNDVALGDIVRVAGRAEEFDDQTQIGAVSSVVVCSSGATVTPTDVSLPFASTGFPERFEGMLVRLPQTLSVTEHFYLGRFGQVVMSSNARLPQPTSIDLPGSPALSIQAANDLNRIILDDDSNNQNPDPILFGENGHPLSAANTLRGGYAAANIIGVMTHTHGEWVVRPVGALGGGVPAFGAANPRPATPTPVGGTARVATFDLNNWFNTFTGCTNGVGGSPGPCRGASDATEFERQAGKTIPAILGIDADVIGVTSLENDGYGASSAIAELVDRLNAVAGAGSYAFIDADAGAGQTNALGTDGIRVGIIYRPATATPVGNTAVLNSTAFVTGGDSGERNRPALAQAFEMPDRARFVVAVNHLKSKGSACDAPDTGDGQGECSIVRTNAANTLAAWLATDPTTTADPDVLIIGDLNSYAMEDPIRALGSAGYADMIAAYGGSNAYAYVFDGQWGYLEHALASTSLQPQVTGVTEWHINADEPGVLDYRVDFKSPGQQASLYSPDAYRSSDQDPVIVGLDLFAPPASYTFGGFMAPVSPYPTENVVRAGQSVPLQFSLGGDQGTAIFSSGFPESRPFTCDWTTVTGSSTEAMSAGASGAQYDASADSYTWVWKTDAAWAGTCRELVVRLADETVHRARFRFRP